MPDQTVADYERLRQENERLWKENASLRPMVSDLQHRLSVAIHYLKHVAEAETATLLRKDTDTHG